MTIQPIVEGQGDVAAVPVLLRRLCDKVGAYGIQVGRPIRRTRAQMAQEDSVRKSIRLALLKPQCSAILLLFDSDDDCPKDLAPKVEAWARSEAHGVPSFVVMATREYEAWFLAAIESLRGKRGIKPDASLHADPETPRDAKGELDERMQGGQTYAETSDQAPLTALFDMAAAYARCRSFRRLAKVFQQAVAGMGLDTPHWPPDEWAAARRHLLEGAP